jgi:hypothetical protein
MVSRSSIDFSRIEIQPVRVFYLKMHASPEDTLQENNTVTFEQLSSRLPEIITFGFMAPWEYAITGLIGL